MSNLKFAKTHNLVAFLEKPEESDGFEGIIDFLNASSIRYALTIQALSRWGKKVIHHYKDKCVKDLFIKRCEGQAPKELGEGSEIPTDPQHTPTIIQTSTSQPQKKQLRRKQRKDIEVPQPSGSTKPITNEAANAEHVPTHSNDPLFSGEDRLQLKELLELCTKLSERVLDLDNTKTSQAAEITKLKERVKKMERRNKSRTPGLKRLRKVGRSAQVVSSKDEGLGAQEDASKQGRKITDLDVDAEEVEDEKVVSTAEVTTISATTTTINELTLAQTLIEIKAAKPKVVTTAATTTTTAVTRPKARGVVKLAKQKEEDANIAEWDNVQAMIDADYELATILQAQEQEELIIEEWSKMFVELMDKKKKKYFCIDL
ncbi:hypothetical protein Tco_0385677 [Tanacetum coccineum]